MPAIAPQSPAQVVIVWDMPFAVADARSRVVTDPPMLHGEWARKTAKEAANAIRRFRSSLIDEIASVTMPWACVLDPLTARDDLRAFAATQGVDFDAIVAGAARHFTSAIISRRTDPLSQEELESLFEDDQRAFDR